MSDGWALKTIAECALDEPYATQIGPFGKALMAEQYTSSGVPVLRGVNVNRGRFHDDDFVFISESTADALSKFESFPGDVLLVHKGTLGQIGLMPSKRRHQRYIMGNSMLRVRCDPSVLLPEFLYYWLSSPQGQDYLFSRVSQVGVPQLQRPLTTLREAQLRVPPVHVQSAITSRLEVLDDTIELNQRMNHNLERLARLIFEAWFVDFAPVRAKAEGATSFPGMSSDAFESLPTELVDAQIGPVPAGWDLVPLSALLMLHGGGTPKRDIAAYWNGSVPWFSVRDAPADSDVWVIDTAERITDDGVRNSAAKVLPPGTTVISARGTVGRLALIGTPMAINQSCYGAQGADGVGDYFVYFSLQHAAAELRRHTHGSVFDTITRATFDSLQRVRPPQELLQAFEDTVAPYMLALRNNCLQSKTLGALRDILLPELISGAMRVPETGVADGDQ
ncbi:MAG TPA: restriction endonuclease subunit S [Thermoleophilaceae bacterium]|nr:restriction endonuclease subunit S [Thermoleophilaceae bacterium]